MADVKLSPVQQKVMDYLKHGHVAYTVGVGNIHINGQKFCNLDTMKALERKGLVVQSEQWRRWKAAE